MGKKLCLFICFSLFCVFTLGLYIVGFLRYLTDVEPNSCDMTYMFEYPQYVRIRLNSKLEKKYPKYGLYAYGEGYATEKLRRMQFNGIPVLFVPGNSGSYEQVRSLSSVSLRMSIKRRTPFHFDYFSVSLAEGLSALYGGVLEEQTEFVYHCIKRILRLYDGRNDKVILIGHSMGGIIAKAALLYDSKTNESLASILINLSAPYKPRIAFDKTFVDFYSKIYTQEKRLKEMGTNVISIGGGPRDLMVTSSNIIDESVDLNVLSTAIPNVWRSPDHLSILWCKQLVIVIVRALFDCVDTSRRTSMIKTNPLDRIKSLSYHLSDRFAGKLNDNYESKIHFESDNDINKANNIWIEITSSSYTNDKWNTTDRKQMIYLTIPLNLPMNNYISLDIINLDAKDWFFICTNNNNFIKNHCKWGWNLTNQTRLTPDLFHRKRKSIDIPVYKLNNATNIVVKIPGDEAQKKLAPIVHIDMYDKQFRMFSIQGSISKWIPEPINSILSSQKNHELSIPIGTLRYFIYINDISDAIYVTLKSVTNSKGEKSNGYVIFHVIETWNPNATMISQFYTMTEKDVGNVEIFRFQTENYNDNLANVIEMRLSLDPRSAYLISIKRAGLIDRIVKTVRDNWNRIHLMIIGYLILTLSFRMSDCTLKRILSFELLFFTIFLYHNYLEYYVAFGFLIVFTLVLSCIVVFFGSISHNFAAKLVSKLLIRLPVSWYDWLLRQVLQNLPFIACFFMVTTVLSSCSAVAVLISLGIYFLRLIYMYEDYIEELFMATIKTFAGKIFKSKKFNCKKRPENQNESNENTITDIINHLLLFVIWFFTAVSAVPTVLVWARNFSYEKRLTTEDPIMWISWCILTVWMSSGIIKIPIPHFKVNKYEQIIVMTLQLIGWKVLYFGGLKNAVNYEWLIPVDVAISITLIGISNITQLKLFKNDKKDS